MSSLPLAVVFDLDGLMFNTEELYQDVGKELLRRRGHELTVELLDLMMGRPGRDALQIMIDRHALTDTVEGLAAESREIFKPILATRLAPMPGLLALLDRLEAEGLAKAIATSSGQEFLHAVLSPFGLAARFAFMLTAESVTHGKPHPEVYQTAAARFGVPPNRMLVLEDSKHGCQAAVAAGAIAVAVPHGISRRYEFPGAALVADTLADPRLYRLLGF